MSDRPLVEEVLARHLQPVRGMALAHAIFAAFEVGIIDALEIGGLEVDVLADRLGLHPERLAGLLDHLENEGLVSTGSDVVQLTRTGHELSLVRPWYDLFVGGYAATFGQLPDVLRNRSGYAGRNGAKVAAGSCGISQHDALRMVLSLLQGEPPPSALVDLGCGDGTFVAELAVALPGVPTIGVEPDPGARSAALAHASLRGLSDLRILEGDAVHFPDEVVQLPEGACYLTAFVLQEVLEQSGRAAVVDLLRRPFDRDPTASWIVVEVDLRQPLTTEPSDLALAYYNPYFLLHRITEQRLLPVAEWRAIYRDAGLVVVGEVWPDRGYDPLGIKFGHRLRRAGRPS